MESIAPFADENLSEDNMQGIEQIMMDEYKTWEWEIRKHDWIYMHYYFGPYISATLRDESPEMI